MHREVTPEPVGSQCGTCFMQTAWRLEFGRGVWNFVKFVDHAALRGGGGC